MARSYLLEVLRAIPKFALDGAAVFCAVAADFFSNATNALERARARRDDPHTDERQPVHLLTDAETCACRVTMLEALDRGDRVTSDRARFRRAPVRCAACLRAALVSPLHLQLAPGIFACGTTSTDEANKGCALLVATSDRAAFNAAENRCPSCALRAPQEGIEA